MDETGQDTGGELFVVAVVIAEQDVEPLRLACERIEQETGKRSLKWIRTNYDRRLAYVRAVVQAPIFRYALYAATHRGRKDYFDSALRTIAHSLAHVAGKGYEATIRIDGLPRSLERAAAAQLRRMGVAAGKVRGIRKDENDALIRLADAVCGWVRAAGEGQPEMQALLERAIRLGVVCDLSG